MENLAARIGADTDRELQQMIELFQTHNMPLTDCAMRKHFEIAKIRPEAFRNHRQVLAFSFGGSNTKVMLGHTKDGEIYADALIAQPNPDEQIHLYDYLDQICKNPVIDRYLRETPELEIGVSIPMFIVNGCPFSPTKIPTIDGFIARSEAEFGDALNFEKNFAEYMRSRGYTNPYHLYYQSDGIVAHIGAVSVSDARLIDKTILCVCGTGMATADENNYIIPAYLTTILPDDEELWPAAATENRQLNYAIAGKGLFGLMRRACDALVRQGGSALEGKDYARFFATAKESRTVCELAQKAFGVSYSSKIIDPIAEAVGEDGMRELEALAAMIVTRVWESLSNTILSTGVSMGPLQGDGKYVVFLEGSIARNPLIKENVFKEVERKKAAYQFADVDGTPISFDYIADPALRRVKTELPELEPLLDSIDVTLIGAMTMVIADELAKKGE